MIRERMYAALGATNEAILRNSDQDELFQRVCEAAVHGGGLKSAAALLPESDHWLRIVAVSGMASGMPVPDLRISINPLEERGQGLAGSAFRSGMTAWTNDFQNDPRMRPWLRDNLGSNLGAAAAVPIIRSGKSVGVFLFFIEASGAITREVLDLLERMVENVAFALDMFDRDKQRTESDRTNRRLSDMFAALSATNTAILRSRTRQEMFAAVCNSVVMGKKSLGAASILIEDPSTKMFDVVAAAGAGVDAMLRMRLSSDPSHQKGRGLAGVAFREQKLAISHDLNTDGRTKAYAARQSKPYGGAAVPLIVDKRSVGVLYFFFAPISAADDSDKIFQLMEDIGENVSFALAMFEQEDQKLRCNRRHWLELEVPSCLSTSIVLRSSTTRWDMLRAIIC